MTITTYIINSIRAKDEDYTLNYVCARECVWVHF